MKVQHPWRGRVFQDQVMIRFLNYQQHASHGLLRHPSLLRGINMMPSTSRHFFRISAPHNMLDQVYDKAPPPQQTKTTQLETKISGEWISVNDFEYVFPFLITPLHHSTTFDYCKRRMSRNMTGWLIVKPYSTVLRFGIATNVSGSCDLVKRKLEVSSPNKQASNHQPFTKKHGENTSSNPKESMNGVFIHTFNPVNYQHVDISTIRWVSGRQKMVWFLLKKTSQLVNLIDDRNPAPGMHKAL